MQSSGLLVLAANTSRGSTGDGGTLASGGFNLTDS
jgi:hypothetical protein